MEPNNIHFGGGALGTLLHPFVALELIVAVSLILRLPRKYVLAPVLLGIFTIPLGQVVLLAGVHFTVPRILIMAGLVRWAISPRQGSTRLFRGGTAALDWILALYALISFGTFSLNWMTAQALVKGLGTLLDTLGGYLVFRFLIRDVGDVRRAIKIFGVIALILGACMLNERLTGTNIFRMLGGLPPTAIREGVVRSQAAFENYLTAGVFGATLIPLLVWLWGDSKRKTGAVLAIAGATIMAFTTQSSTPVMVMALGAAGLCFWPLRKRMRAIRWGLVLTIVVLDLAMKAPVWALIGRVDLTGASSGYHRYMLVDNLIRHFSDWWFMGSKNYSTWGWDMWDLSNQYVACGESSGLLALLLFILIISKGFGLLGKARKYRIADRRHKWLFWCLGASLFAHMVAYFGVNYYDQMQFSWYALLAMIAAAVTETMSVPVPRQAAAGEEVAFWLAAEPPVHHIM